MRLPRYLPVMILFVAIISACNSAEQKPAEVAAAKKAIPVQPPFSDGIRRVTVPELQDLLAKGQAVVIDVRNQASYDQGHIKGAKLIPMTEIQNHLSELPKNKTIVTYCS
jgi:predicted sulfurtransferase